MRKRYCETILQEQRPCGLGWGSVGKDGVKGCDDAPLEKNCRNIVNTEDPHICPTCGTVLGIIGDFMEEKK